MEAPATKAPAAQPLGLGTSAAQDDLMRMCSHQGQQQQQQQQQQHQQQQLHLGAPPKRSRFDVGGEDDIDEAMELDDLDALWEEEDEERGSAWVEPPEEPP